MARVYNGVELSLIHQLSTLEPQLSKISGEHTIKMDNQWVQIDEVESHSVKNWGSVGNNQ